MKTNAEYIREFSLFDEVMSCIYESDEDVSKSLTEYTIALHKAEMENFFEAASEETKKEVSDKKESVFAKIGNAVMNIINKLTSFIADLGEKLLGLVKKTETDQDKVEKILKAHPDLKNQVVKGLNKEWFTYKDVAQYEKDVVGLCKMLEQSQIDHKTFTQKLSEAAKKFNDSAKPVLEAGLTVAGLIGLAGTIKKNADNSKKALSSWKNKFKDFGDNVKGYKNEKDVNIAQAIFSAFNEVNAARVEDANKHYAAVKGFDGILGKILGLAGGKGEEIYINKTNKDIDEENRIIDQLHKKHKDDKK